MTTHQLTCFLALAKHLNYTSTANELYISQPTLSRTISALEGELGNYLFIRDTRMVQLTEAGRCFLRYAKQFMDLYNEAMVVVESTATGKRGAVHVGLSHFGAGDLLPILAVKLKEQYPDLNTATTDGPQQELMGALIDSKIDVLFTNDRALDYKTSGLSHIPLYNIPLMVFTSPEHPFTKYGRAITIDDMKSENILTMEPTAYDSPPLSQLRVPLERRSRCIPSQVRILSMIENGEGIALLHAHMKTRFITSAVALPFENSQRDTYRAIALWSDRNTNPALPYFLEVLKVIVEAYNPTQELAGR